MLVVVLVVVLVWRHLGNEKKVAPAPPKITVTTATAKKGDIGVYLDEIGTVTQVHTDSITGQVNGLVVAVHFKEGQLVRKGDPLIDIDSRTYRATLLQALGMLERDENMLAQAKMDLERYRAAVARNAIAKQQLDDQEKVVLQDEGTVKNDQGTVQFDQIQVEYCHITAGCQRAEPLDYRWARIRRCRAGPSHFASTARNRLCAFMAMPQTPRISREPGKPTNVRCVFFVSFAVRRRSISPTFSTFLEAVHAGLLIIKLLS